MYGFAIQLGQQRYMVGLRFGGAFQLIPPEKEPFIM